jgi:hypothetical protein
MPLLAYLAGQRDPDGHMIIVALDLNVGMEIDVCHFSACGVPELGHSCWPGLSGGSLVFVDEAAEDGPAPDLFLGEVGDGVVRPGRVQLAGRRDVLWGAWAARPALVWGACP